MTNTPPSSRNTLRRRLVWATIIAGSVTAAAAAVWLPGEGSSGITAIGAQSSPPVSAQNIRGVRVMTADAETEVEEKRFTGVIVARYEAPLSFRVAGRIDARTVELGDRVVAGQPLLRLDSGDYRAASQAAQANLAAAEATALQAKAEEARQAQLLAQGWIAQARYDVARAAADAATATVEAARAALTLTLNQQSYAVLTTPHDGIITALTAETGEVISAGQAVLTLARSGASEVEVAIPEGQIAGLTEWTAEVALWAQEKTLYPASLREVAPQAAPVGRTHAARFALPPDLLADLGATATIVLSRAASETSVELPSSAVFFRDGRATVWIVVPSGDRALPQEVRIVRLGTDTTRVRGLADGSRVITLGVHRVDETLAIRVIEDVALSSPEVQP
jgi:membrane fusion protein, multidrug efflux system